ncbi:hypothetical protein [Streptomyces boluensis]|uniref:Uncharacterized protein n=1 Tax=Streptomyces boluensis TaxID=1775135 RepID=A0A964XMU2_9ACTN|nr:hypothetical protein [Streptomyces boluensis]NBE53526.1 hypothetical protein [Streptomyces boluensis]
MRRLALPVRPDAYGPLRTADGTCAGVPAGRAAGMGLETARDGAPHERCLLTTAEGEPRTELTASFGPYARAEFRGVDDREPDDQPSAELPFHRRGKDDLQGWTTAKCPDGLALFTVNPVSTGPVEEGVRRPAPDLAQEHAALKEFATRAAEAHGCSAPATGR